MKITVKDDTYEMLISLLKDIKLTQGNLALNSTLNRHQKVKKFLLQSQVDTLQDLEDSIKSD